MHQELRIMLINSKLLWKNFNLLKKSTIITLSNSGISDQWFYPKKSLKVFEKKKFFY